MSDPRSSTVAPAAPYGCAGTLMALGVVAGAIAYWVATSDGVSARAVYVGASYAGCAAPLLLFGGLALLMHHFRELREARYGEDLQEASRLDELVLHRVSIALPSREAARLVSDLTERSAHRIFDRFEPLLLPGVPFGHVRERHGADVDAEELLDRAARTLEDRTRADASGSYRDEARASIATGDEGDFVVASVLVLAHPTATSGRPVRSSTDARTLRDAILPVAPEHTRAARLVTTPSTAGRTFDATALAVAFPELSPLSLVSIAGASPSPDLDDATALVRERAVRFALEDATLETAVEQALETIERDEEIVIRRPPGLASTIARYRAVIAEHGTPGRAARRAVLEQVQQLANAALVSARRPRRVTRVVSIDGEPVLDACLVLVTPAERERLRGSGRVLVTPWMRDVLPGLALLPLAMMLGAKTGDAIVDLDPTRVAYAALGWAAWIGAHRWLRRRRVGLAMGPHAPG